MKVPKRVIAALRKQHEKQPKDYDLHTTWGADTHIDVVFGYDNRWRVSVGQVTLENTKTREEAITAIENFVL